MGMHRGTTRQEPQALHGEEVGRRWHTAGGWFILLVSKRRAEAARPTGIIAEMFVFRIRLCLGREFVDVVSIPPPLHLILELRLWKH